MFHTILIANRGEIACRIIKTAKRLGIRTIALYSTADKAALHVSMADEAYCIGAPQASESYLNIEKIINIALLSKSEAIHPGYGFLSENPAFAKACEKAGIVFIGPNIHALETMGSKQLAKQLLEKTKVPLTPGYHGLEQGDERLLNEAKAIGFPVLLKAAAGGGGKGMRTVEKEADFFEALAGARREALSSFADETMIIEKLIQNPRHVEMQIMGDSHGTVLHLFERDCSIQRRHQKIIEEAQAPNLSSKLRQQLAEAAVTVAKTIHYQGAGTIEFLVDENENFYFMEMNTRLQVEHPVTEMITGLDLVELQLRVAAKEALAIKQEEIQARGHAIECRIYAEDPSQNFLPSIGPIRFLREPNGEGVRIDTGIQEGSEISRYYDPMIAKLICWGDDRQQAILRMQQALAAYHLGGVKNNIPFLQAIIHHPEFIKAKLSTGFLVEEKVVIESANAQEALFAAAAFDYVSLFPKNPASLEADSFAWQMHLSSTWTVRYLRSGELLKLQLSAINANQFKLEFENKTYELKARMLNGQLGLEENGVFRQYFIEDLANQLVVYSSKGLHSFERFHWQNSNEQASNTGQLTAPMPATIVAILKNKGDKIKAGERLIVLEAMKMEHTIRAPKDGLLKEIFFTIGAQVSEGAELLSLADE